MLLNWFWEYSSVKERSLLSSGLSTLAGEQIPSPLNKTSRFSETGNLPQLNNSLLRSLFAFLCFVVWGAVISVFHERVYFWTPETKIAWFFAMIICWLSSFFFSFSYFFFHSTLHCRIISSTSLNNKLCFSFSNFNNGEILHCCFHYFSKIVLKDSEAKSSNFCLFYTWKWWMLFVWLFHILYLCAYVYVFILMKENTWAALPINKMLVPCQ